MSEEPPEDPADLLDGLNLPRGATVSVNGVVLDPGGDEYTEADARAAVRAIRRQRA